MFQTSCLFFEPAEVWPRPAKLIVLFEQRLERHGDIREECVVMQAPNNLDAEGKAVTAPAAGNDHCGVPH